MMTALLTTLYGLSFIGGLFLTLVWGRVAKRASCAPSIGTPLDQFCLIAIGLCAGSLGNVLIFGTRTVVSLMRGIDPVIAYQPGVLVIILGLTVLVISKGVLMWAYDPTHSTRGWRWFAVLSVLWIILAPFYMMGGIL